MSVEGPPNQLAHYVPALREADEEFRLRLLLHDFCMVWQHSDAVTRQRLVEVEPDAIDDRWDAFAAALVEHLCAEAGLAVPSWTQTARRHLERFWYAGGCFAFDRLRTVVTTPAAFEMHGVWLPRSELEVV